MNKHIILDFQTGEKVENNNNSLPQNNAFNYADNLIQSKSLAKNNCYLLIHSIRIKHGLNLHISTFKPFSGKTDKSVWSIVNDINNSSDLMQTKNIQSCRIACHNTIKSILDEK